ncbi:MAG: hypothetical protein EOM59_03015 [Clostridia bacterium]|nr:hypothetical protein [Clostridia bacterium]
MLKKNKWLALLLIICICFALTACSSGGETEEISEPMDDMEEEMGDLDLDVATGSDVGDGAKIPDTYPSDLFPIYEGSYIFSIVEYEGSFTVTAFSKDDYNEVAEFYKDFLSDTPVTYETNSATGYTRFGTIDSYTYNFDTGLSDEFEDYASSIAIMLMPAQ